MLTDYEWKQDIVSSMAIIPAPHVLSSVTITNNTNAVLPISAGVKLQAQQTKTVYLSSVQQQEEMVPRLEKLRLAGKVNYQLTPGIPQDIGAAGGLGLAGAGQAGANPLVSIPSPTALAQTTWYINPVAGNDNNSGLAAAPIKTYAEYIRRTGLGRPINNAVNIYIVSDLPATDPLIISGTTNGRTGSGLHVHGVPTVLATGTLTGWTAPVAATNTLPAITDTAVADWTPYAGKLLRLTSGPRAGVGCFWIIKNLGGNTARVSNPVQGLSSPLNFVPAGTETYEILELPNVPVLTCTASKGNNFAALPGFDNYWSSVEYIKTPSFGGLQSILYGSQPTAFFQCLFIGVFATYEGVSTLVNCSFQGTVLVGAYASFYGGYFNGATVLVAANSYFSQSQVPIAIRAGSFTAQNGSQVDFFGNTPSGAVGCIQIADTTNYFTIKRFASMYIGSDLYGGADAGTMFTIAAGSRLGMGAVTNVRIGGAVADFNVAGQTSIFPIVTATGLPAAAVQLCSLANFANAAIFNGKIHDPFTGTAVVVGA